MKIGLLLLSILFSTAYAKSQPAKENFIDSISQMEQVANTRLTMLSPATASYTNFDVTYYRCEWNVDPATRYIEGAVTSYFRVPANTDSIIYDLMDDLAADSILQRGNRLLFQHNNNQIVIYFANTVLATTIDSVTIYYHGIPANTGFGSFINSSHSGTPVMWTLSEPYGSRDWWPCKNGLDDKADSIDVIITTPVQYTAASNGLRQSVVIENNKKITHWKHQYPIATYLICMAITNYEEFTTEVRLGSVTLPMQTFCYPESLQTFLEKTPLVLNSMLYFNNFLGTYPFIREKYGHVQFGWGGGQEHQTATFVVAPDENLMSHELAHQWFGDKVTCGSWQDIWLNEGFATHLASMDYENKYPLTISTNRSKEIENITSLPGGSVFVDDTTNVKRIFDGRLSYRKGSHVIYMLRWILGDSIFFQGARKYLSDSTLRYGFATTADLKRSLESESGKDLTHFFDAWIYGQGYPSYEVKWSQIGADHVKIKLNQFTSHPSVSFFALPVALQFKNGTQQKTVIVKNTLNSEVFIKNIGFIADTVIVDPEYWLITKNNTSEKIIENITGANNVQVFPSPFTDQVNVYVNNCKEPSCYLKIFDTKGALVIKKRVTVNVAAFSEINTAALSKGIYVLKVEAGNSFKFAKKILKL